MPYLTIQQYEDRFTQAELIRLTATGGSAVVDADGFNGALADVSAKMDSYLARRYALPFVDVPPLLVAIAAALVREKLHTQFPTEAVTREADAARRDLRDLATGLASLPVADGDAEPVQTGTTGAQFVAPSVTFTADKLARY